MAVFAIVAQTNPQLLKAAVATQYGANHYEFSNDVWFVSDGGSTKSVADKLGITNGQVGATGVVIEFSAYSGFAQSAAWVWLQQYPEVRPNG